MNTFSKTKLIATNGPSLDDYLKISIVDNQLKEKEDSIDQFLKLQQSGVNVIRFNMSHETIGNHKLRFDAYRRFSKTTKIPLGILIDTKGPEIRVGSIQTDNLELNTINKNDTVTLLTNKHDFVGNGSSFAVSDITKKYNLAIDVQQGDKILVDDGKLILKVISSNHENGVIETQSQTEKYTIKKNKRINLFNKKYSLPFLSEYDIETIKSAVEWDADFLALSFLSNVNELNEVKQIIKEKNPNSQIKIICKIESYEAIQNLESLVMNSDGIMVARGDLALEIGYELVPIIQDRILQLCNKHNKISIVATQMLDSLETKILPTRAEVTDCYYAVKSLADSTMLSSESAASVNPLNSVQVMKRITNFAESNLEIFSSFNFERSYYGSKLEKKLISKIEKLAIGEKQILLDGFLEEEIRLISSTLLNRSFFINPNNYPNITKFTLYKNLNFINEEQTENIYVIKK